MMLSMVEMPSLPKTASSSRNRTDAQAQTIAPANHRGHRRRRGGQDERREDEREHSCHEREL